MDSIDYDTHSHRDIFIYNDTLFKDNLGNSN